VVVTVKDGASGIQLANPYSITVTAETGTFAMSTPFTSHELLAGRLDCAIEAVLKENGTQKAIDTVNNIDFAASGVAGGGNGINNPATP
jgi:hypothetical protein